MKDDLQTAPEFQPYCRALFDALVVAETYTAFGPGLKTMSPEEQQAYVLGYAVFVWEEMGFTDARDLMPAVRKWAAAHKEFPKVAELRGCLSVARTERIKRETEAQRDANGPSLPQSSVVFPPELRSEAKARLAKAECEAETADRKAKSVKVVLPARPEISVDEKQRYVDARCERVPNVRKAGDVAKGDLGGE